MRKWDDRRRWNKVLASGGCGTAQGPIEMVREHCIICEVGYTVVPKVRGWCYVCPISCRIGCKNG